MRSGDPTANCPSCASTYIERMPPVREVDPGDELTSDVEPPASEPRNMRCNACGHTWWVPAAAR